MEIRRIIDCNEDLIEMIFNRAGFKYEAVNQKFFENKDNYLLVAFQENIPTGFLFAYQLESIHNLEPKMFIYSIDVFSDFQNQGVGTALIETLKDLSINTGCDEIFVFTNDSNNKAKALYQKTKGIRENKDDVMYVYQLKNPIV